MAMTGEPQTRTQLNSALLRAVMSAEREGELRRTAVHAARSLIAARAAAGAGFSLALLGTAGSHPQLFVMGVLWLVFVSLAYWMLSGAAFRGGAASHRWIASIAARSLLASTMVVFAAAVWDASTLPASLLGSAAVLEGYGHLAVCRVRSCIAPSRAD
jgi:hypothetical protein